MGFFYQELYYEQSLQKVFAWVKDYAIQILSRNLLDSEEIREVP